MLFVSAFFRRPADQVYRSVDFYLQTGRHLVRAGVPLRLYTSLDLVEPLRRSWADLPHHHVEIRTDLSLVEHWQRQDLVLPTGRSAAKDTAFYFCVQLSKLKFLAHAAEAASHLAWIDYGAFHMIRDVASGQAHLQAIERSLPQSTLDKLLSPAGVNFASDAWNVPDWTFLGTVLFGTRAACVEAYQRQEALVEASLPRLTWEINYWSAMEDAFLRYAADHDDRILSQAVRAIAGLLPAPPALTVTEGHPSTESTEVPACLAHA